MTTGQSTQQRRPAYSGNSKKTLESGAMLGAKWWAVGDKVVCLFQRDFETKFGLGHEFMLSDPKTLTVFVDEFGSTYKRQPDDGTKGTDRQITRFAIPPLAGFGMAIQDLQANGYRGFAFGDRVTIECTDVEPAIDLNRSPMPMFSISVG
jgi:hypothetical protein